VTNSVKVVADNCPHKGIEITVYSSKSIETITRTYALAAANGALRDNQKHIGERCLKLVCALLKSSTKTIIQQVCNFTPEAQPNIQHTNQDLAKAILDSGFRCSVGGKIAIKTDMLRFMNVPLPTLNYHLTKHRNVVEPIPLDIDAIRTLGSTAWRMNGYHFYDVVKIVLSMDSVIGIDLKEQIFGKQSSLTKLKHKINWSQSLARVFAGFDFYENYVIAGQKVFFFVKTFNLILELETQQSLARKQHLQDQSYHVVHFMQQMEWEVLFNRILRTLFLPDVIMNQVSVSNSLIADKRIE